MKFIRQCSFFEYEAPALSSEMLHNALSQHVFSPCAPTAERSAGFETFPEILGGQFVVSSDSFHMMQYRIQTKSVPASLINAQLKDRIESIQLAESRKVKGKEKKELKEAIKDALMVRAFPKDSYIRFFVDTQHHRVLIESTGEKSIEEIVGLLIKHIPDLTLTPWSKKDIQAASVLKSLFIGEHEAQVDESIFGEEIKLSGGIDGSLIHYKKMNLWHPSIYTTIEEHPFVEVSMHHDNVSFTFLPQTLQFKGINAKDMLDEHKESLKEIEDPILLVQTMLVLQQGLMTELFDYMNGLLETA